MTARPSKETLSFMTANVLNVAESSAALEVVSEALPVPPIKSAAVDAQIEAGEAFMARYEQTFLALAQ
jgi:hypothetical protein